MSNRNWIKLNKLSFFIKLLINLGLMGLLSSCSKIAVLNPKGTIAADERDMILIAVALMLIIVIPVFIMTFAFAYKYRATNTKAKYTPDWAHSTILEIVWWAIPCVIIIILGTITWTSSHRLDPYRPLDSKIKPITIQVIALDWKWLFIYPEENIATVNFIQFPDHVPINFRITADAPMNAFFIPQLGGQIYAMAGMQTKLHLFATDLGDYPGFSASFSGPGFSEMRFVARVSSKDEYNNWLNTVRQSKDALSMDRYNILAKPSENNKVQYFGSVQKSLYDDVMMKFMMPMDMNNSNNGMSNMRDGSEHMINNSEPKHESHHCNGGESHGSHESM